MGKVKPLNTHGQTVVVATLGSPFVALDFGTSIDVLDGPKLARDAGRPELRAVPSFKAIQLRDVARHR